MIKFCDIWPISLNGLETAVESMLQLLDKQENFRANRFKFKKDRHRYILAHGCLREVLSLYSGTAPQQIVFTNNAYGKPHLLNTPFHFNLSHSGNMLLICVYSEGAVGVDVEKVNLHFSLEAMPPGVLDDEERDQLFSLAPDQQRRSFYQLWTQKEAFVKAQGIGLWGLPAVTSLRQSPNWSCQSVDLGAEYCASVVFEIPFGKSSLAQPTPKIKDGRSILVPST